MLLWIFITGALIQNGFAFNITFCTTFKCPDLSKYNITCKFVENTIDCLRSINKNEVQLGYATAYKAIAAKELLPNIEVLADVKDSSNSSQWIYEVVVVTNKPVANFGELRNFTYCNYGVGSSIPKYIIDGLERTILKRYTSPSCDQALLDEAQVCNLNQFFGPSCRAGGWMDNLRTEVEAKKWAYLKLCQLCPGDKCETGYPPEQCLQVDRGAVAIAPLHVASKWNTTFYYLCQNGTTSTTPCAWHKQSWPLLFTHKGFKQRIEPVLNEILSICAFGDSKKCLYPLAEILTTTSNPYITVLNDTKDLITTLQPYKLSKNKPIRWCTTSKVEYEKCTWLKVFSGTLIYPIDCVLRNSTMNCIIAIEEHEADMTEIVAWPIRDTRVSPIALSKTPHSLYIDSGKYSECRDIFYFEGSVLTMTSKYIASCPFQLKFRAVCTKQDYQLCHYHSEVIMRINDPNRGNAKTILSDLTTYFSENSKKRPFDFFGRFNGVPNLLLQDNTTDFYYLKYRQPIKTNTNSRPDWTPTTVTTKSSSGWKTFGYVAAGILIFIVCFVVSGGRICVICF